MKKTDLLKELKGLSVDELRERARKSAEELMKLRFRAASGQLEHGHRLRETRRNLARIQTMINQRGKAA